MATYRTEFIEAIERTKKYNLEVPELFIERHADRLIHQNNREGLFKLLDEKVYYEPLENIIGQCLHYSFHFLNSISEYLKCDVWLTFGYLQIDDHKFFYQEERDIVKLFDSTQYKINHNIHAWLTLPSLEIIDLTFFPTLIGHQGIKFQGVSNPKQAYICSEEQLGNNEMKHRPIFIGTDFLYKIGAAIDLKVD